MYSQLTSLKKMGDKLIQILYKNLFGVKRDNGLIGIGMETVGA